MLPQLTCENRFFWTSGADGKLRFLRCPDCGRFVHPPQPLCPGCLSENLAPHAVAGTGVVDSFTINHQKWRPDLAVPSIIARVRIDGAPGVVLTTNIIGCTSDEIDIEVAVRVEFEQIEDVYLPLFRKTG